MGCNITLRYINMNRLEYVLIQVLVLWLHRIVIGILQELKNIFCVLSLKVGFSFIDEEKGTFYVNWCANIAETTTQKCRIWIILKETCCAWRSGREINMRRGKLIVLVVFDQLMYICTHLYENRPGKNTWPEKYHGGRCWVRTSDPCRVKAVLSRWANRPGTDTF